jgi:hypothetical protein
LVVALGVAGCTVDGTGIGTLAVDGGDAGGGAGGMAGSGGSGGTAGQPADGPAPDTASGGDADSAIPDGPIPRYANGWPCTDSRGCTSGFCVDNVCCESPCSGPCVACARPLTNRPDGECRPIPGGLDPQEECADEGTACGRTGACSGNGGCAMGPSGLACGPSSCNGNIVTPPPRCDGAGACEPQPAQICADHLRCADGNVCKGTCAGNGDCVTGSRCDLGTGTCSAPKPLGAACDPADDGDDCGSGNCVDGVCCDSRCEDLCSACSQARTGVPSGTCAPVEAGKDPDNECEDDDPSSCDDDGTCDGAGECRKYPDGTVCASQCCGGGGNRVCTFACRLGNCDMNTPTEREQCSGVGACCCSSDGEAACASGVACLTCSND